jgi:hypothetical protein
MGRLLTTTESEHARSPLPRPRPAVESPSHAPRGAGLPRFLRSAASKYSPAPATDPAEREARAVGAEVARQPAVTPAHGAARTADGGLPESVRAPAESVLGKDFRDVRVRTDAAADATSRALHARAFTVGDEIAFASGEYDPGTPRGRELIAHELTHVAQQRQAAPGAAPALQRQGDESQPLAVSDEAADQAHWRRRVDAAVRAHYRLGGAGVGAAQVDFVDAAEFARRYPTREIEETLLNLFLAHGTDHRSRFYHLLDHNHHPFHVTGATTTRDVDDLRAFVRRGIGQGYFEGQTRELDVTTGARFPVFRVAPGELIAEHVGGVTDIASATRTGRRITMQVGAYIDTLTHEICHFYVSNAFRDMAERRTDGGEYLRGARIRQILHEGFTEYFAQQVMEANASTLGPSTGVSYPDEVRVVWDLVVTLGEATVRAAYFGGESPAVARVSAAIDVYKDTHPDLLVPDFVVPGAPGRR